MSRLIVLCLYWLSLATIASPLSPPEPCTAQIQHIYMTKALVQSERPPQTGWQMVDLPEQAHTIWQNNANQVWYRIDWQYQCPSHIRTPVAFAISSIQMAGKIYINNDLLWKNKSLNEPLSRSWNMPYYWLLPASALQQGHNTIWIGVVSSPIQAAQIGKFIIGEPETIQDQYQSWWLKQRTFNFIRLICSVTVGLICFLIWLFRRKETVLGWFSLTCLFWSLFIGYLLKTESYPFPDSMSLEIIGSFLRLFYINCFCIYIWRFSNRKYPLLEKIMGIQILAFIIAGFFLPQNQLYWFLPFLVLWAGAIFFINCFFYLFIAYSSKQIEQYLLALCFIFCIINSAYIFLFTSSHTNLFFSPYSAPLTGLFIIITLAIRLARNIKLAENFNKILEKNIQQVKHELGSSLHTQHQLELQNTRLQERINLAHDLHDSLGGSLVRSMMMIDQSKRDLNKQQFLSILKLLRDDLRQVIDHGSSHDSRIPDSPVQWGASIRHRFSQLFDELDIISSWSFPAQWQFQPTTFECLTLLRVAEEALTNIIKHSQANNVKVSLYYTHDQQLILEIEDDGIGFNTEAVKQSGISIGIRSMQIRLEKIHAHMSLQSSPGKTVIQAIKPCS